MCMREQAEKGRGEKEEVMRAEEGEGEERRKRSCVQTFEEIQTSRNEKLEINKKDCRSPA